VLQIHINIIFISIKKSIELDLSKGQLAAMLGTISETLLRVFSKLSREGAIEVDGFKVKPIDRERLNILVE
jgi:CRP-like cAMP-binding protein